MQKPRLLYISMGRNDAIELSMGKVFDLTVYDWTDKLYTRINPEILRLHSSVKPHAVFMQLHRGGIINPETSAQMKRTSFVANWTGDVRAKVQSCYYELAPYVSITLFPDMEEVNEMMLAGNRAEFFNCGLIDSIYTPNGKRGVYPDIMFTGSNYGSFPLSKLRRDMVQAMIKTYGANFGLFGAGWGDFRKDVPYLSPEQEAIAFRSCKIAINISHFFHTKCSNVRMLKSMGSGALCITYPYPKIEEEFQQYKHLDIWYDVNDLINKINYYLDPAHEAQRKATAKEGCRFVHENHTWYHRMLQFKKIAGL